MEPIGVEGFDKVEVRVGTIVSAEPNRKARKPAYKRVVDFGKNEPHFPTVWNFRFCLRRIRGRFGLAWKGGLREGSSKNVPGPGGPTAKKPNGPPS